MSYKAILIFCIFLLSRDVIAQSNFYSIHRLRVDSSGIEDDLVINTDSLLFWEVSKDKIITLNNRGDIHEISSDRKSQHVGRLINIKGHPFEKVSDIKIRPGLSHLGYIFENGNLIELNIKEKIHYGMSVYPFFLRQLQYANDNSFIAIRADYYKDCDTCGSSLIIHRTFENTKVSKKQSNKKRQDVESLKNNKLDIEKKVSIVLLENKFSFSKLDISPSSKNIATIDKACSIYTCDLVYDTIRKFIHNDYPFVNFCFYSDDTIITINDSGRFSLIGNLNNSITDLQSDFSVHSPIFIKKFGEFIMIADKRNFYLSKVFDTKVKLVYSFRSTTDINRIKIDSDLKKIFYD